MIKFKAGELVTIDGYKFELEEYETGYFRRQIKIIFHNHINGNWGEVCEERAAMNDQAINNGGSIVSKHRIDNQCFYLTTDVNRQKTTIKECSPY